MRDRDTTRQTTTIAVSKDVMDKLFEVRNDMESKTKKHVSYSNVIAKLLELYNGQGEN